MKLPHNATWNLAEMRDERSSFACVEIEISEDQPDIANLLDLGWTEIGEKSRSSRER